MQSGNDASTLLEFLTMPTLFNYAKRREEFISAIGDKEFIKDAVMNVSDRHLIAMSDSGLVYYWIVALKTHFAPELLRLHELDQFLAHFEKLQPRLASSLRKREAPVEENWLELCLRNVYNEVLVNIDRTLFYTPKFLELHFTNKENPRALDYFKYFLLSITESDVLSTRILSLDRDTPIFEEMWRLSLGSYYSNSSASYRRIDTENESTYSLSEVIDRATLFFTVTELFNAIRIQFRDQEYNEENVKGIRLLFEDIRRIVSTNQSRTIENLFSPVPDLFKPVMMAVIQRINELFGPYTNKNAHYSILFGGTDDLLTFDRIFYEWLLPFDRDSYLRERKNTENKEKEVAAILRQESRIWINLILYHLYLSNREPVVSKKRSGEESEDSSSDSSKRPRVGRSVLLQQYDQSYILSVIHGSGTLSIIHGNNEFITYPVSKGDNIRMPNLLLDYNIVYEMG